MSGGVRAGIAFALALALAGACSTPPKASDAGARIVSEDELPPEERDVLHAWRAGGETWSARRPSVAADERLSRFLVDNLVREMVRAYDASRIAKRGEPEGPFERARAELVLLHERSTPVLAQMLDLKDGVVAFLAADVLARIGADAVEPVARQLRAPRPETRRRAAELLARLPHAGAHEIEVEEELAAVAERDSAWIARAEAARALGARGSRHEHKGYAMGVLMRALRDADDAVATSAGEALAALGEPRAIPGLARELDRAADAGRPRVVRSVEAALAKLSGDPRSRSGAAWLEWWSRNEPRFSAPRGDARARH